MPAGSDPSRGAAPRRAQSATVIVLSSPVSAQSKSSGRVTSCSQGWSGAQPSADSLRAADSSASGAEVFSVISPSPSPSIPSARISAGSICTMPISPAQAPVVLAGLIMPRSYSVRAARICGWNSSGLRQSWPSVTSAFTVLKSPCTCPKSVSKAQKARRMPRGTPKSCSAASKTASNSLPLARPVCRRLLLISACEKSRKGF